MKNIIKISGQDHQAKIFLAEDEYRVESDRPSQRQELEEQMRNIWRNGIEDFHQASSVVDNRIIVKRQVIKKDHPDFIFALVNELKASHSEFFVSLEQDQEELEKLREQLREKLQGMASGESLQTELRKVLDNIDKFNLSQVELLLKDIEQFSSR